MTVNLKLGSRSSIAAHLPFYSYFLFIFAYSKSTSVCVRLHDSHQYIRPSSSSHHPTVLALMRFLIAWFNLPFIIIFQFKKHWSAFFMCSYYVMKDRYKKLKKKKMKKKKTKCCTNDQNFFLEKNKWLRNISFKGENFKLP